MAKMPWEQDLVAEGSMPWEQGLQLESPKYKGLDVVKQLDTGGMVLREPKAGRLMFIDEKAGFSSTDPKFVERVMAGEDPAKISSQGIYEDVMKETPFEAAQRYKMAEGIPFVRGWLPQIAGAVGGDTAEAQIRARSKAMEEVNPITSTVSKIAGGIGATAPLAAAAPAIPAIEALPLGQKMLAMGGLGSLGGGLEGLIAGAGTGNAAREGIGGAIGGGIGGAIAPPLAKGVENLVKLFTRTDVPNIAKILGISDDAAKVIKTTFAESGGDVNTAIRNIRKAGDLGMIADADTATAILLDAAGAAGGRAATITGEAVTQRAKQEAAQLGGYLDETLAPMPKIGGQAADVQDIATGLSKQTAGARSEAYSRAYGSPIDYSSDQGRNIESLIGRIPDSYLNPAIKRANESMQMQGLKNQQIMADIADDGTITFREMPNVRQLDEIKKALGEIAFGEVDSLGRPTARAQDALKMYRELRNAIGDAAPAYNDAMALASDKISLENALDVGEKMLTNKMSVRDVGRTLSGATESERNMAKLGARSYIQDTLDRVKATITSPDVDINQLRKVLSELSSDASKKKLAALVGVKETQVLYKNLERAKAALALRAAVASNSKTAVRQRVQDQIDQLTEVGALQSLLSGKPMASTQKAIQTLSGATEEFTVERQKEIFKDIAKAMTGIQGRDAKEAVIEIYKAINGQKVNEAQVQKWMNILMRGVAPTGIMTSSTSTARAFQEK